MRFSNILLVLDAGSSHTESLSRAIALARKEDASITVCEVINSIPDDYNRAIVSVTVPELIGSVAAVNLKRLRNLVDAANTEDLSIKVRVLVGKPHIEIAREVLAKEHDLVIKSIAGRRGLRALSARREDRLLMRSCPCPVWLVNAADQSDDSCILAALDMEAEGANGSGLNDHILEAARSIALAEFRQLHIVHAWRLIGEDHARMRGDPAVNLEMDRMVASEMVRRRIWLHDTVRGGQSRSHRLAMDFLDPALHIIKGRARDVVPELAEKLGAGLVIMGTAARSGVAGLLRGNTSEQVLARSGSSFMIVKQRDAPEGLVRPGKFAYFSEPLPGDAEASAGA